MSSSVRRPVGKAAAAAAAAAEATEHQPISSSSGAPRAPTVDEVCYNVLLAPSTKASERTVQKHESKCKELFRAFERPAGSGGCDVRDVGTLVRALNLNPTEATVLKMVEAAEEEQSTGYVKFARLLPVLMEALLKREYAGQVLERDAEATLRRAFAALDSEGTGFVDAETMRELLSKSGQGEPLSAAEADRMIESVADPETGKVSVDDYISLLLDQ